MAEFSASRDQQQKHRNVLTGDKKAWLNQKPYRLAAAIYYYVHTSQSRPHTKQLAPWRDNSSVNTACLLPATQYNSAHNIPQYIDLQYIIIAYNTVGYLCTVSVLITLTV